MNAQNVEVGVVSATMPFRLLDAKELDAFLSDIDQSELEAAERKSKETPDYMQGGNEDDEDDDEEGGSGGAKPQ
jgi:hypothetical protein